MNLTDDSDVKIVISSGHKYFEVPKTAFFEDYHNKKKHSLSRRTCKSLIDAVENKDLKLEDSITFEDYVSQHNLCNGCDEDCENEIKNITRSYQAMTTKSLIRNWKIVMVTQEAIDAGAIKYHEYDAQESVYVDEIILSRYQNISRCIKKLQQSEVANNKDVVVVIKMLSECCIKHTLDDVRHVI